METIYSPVNTAQRAKIDMKTGDTVRVWQKIEEKGKTRLQAFEGLLIARKHGTEPGGTFTVRKIASGVGVEKIFPLYSPIIDRIEIVRRAKVRHSKLYYIREKSAREIRRKMKGLASFIPLDYKEEAPVTQEELDAKEKVEDTEVTQPENTNEVDAVVLENTKEPKQEESMEVDNEVKEEALKEEDKNTEEKK